jgi:hypothetical protein
MLLVQGGNTDLGLALDLAERLVMADQSGLDWLAMPIADLDTLILRLRQALLGNRIATDIACSARGCGSRIDVVFSISDFLEHQTPSGVVRRGRWLAEQVADAPGWFRMVPLHGVRDVDIRFRLPTVADEHNVGGRPNALRSLVEACIDPHTLSRRLQHSVEGMMESMAPPLFGEIEGECPECGFLMRMYFDPRRYCLQELRRRAASIFEEVDLLAHRYHWQEDTILAMPGSRRSAYAEIARQSQAH